MPIKKTLTRTEAARHRANGNRSVSASTEVTVLTEEERVALNTSLDQEATVVQHSARHRDRGVQGVRLRR
ncbi:hypothetical protein [Microbacterium laevaniformans]|uniref:hypothetical protein n=1 Tax=Microbacterium laevaniformans TaxID=36807 RepID=UPI0036281DE1